VNLRNATVLLFVFIISSISATARLRLLEGSYSFVNKSIHAVTVTRLLSDEKVLDHGTSLYPYQSASIMNLDMFPYTLPKSFTVEYEDSDGKWHTDKLDTSWITQKKSKSGEIYFVYTSEQNFCLKIYLETGGDKMRLDGLLLPDEDSSDYKKYKELACASIDGNTQRVRELLTNGAAYYWPNLPSGLTPLGWAVRWNHVETFEVLFQKMPKDFYPYEFYWCIKMAAQNGELEILKRLLESDLANNVPSFPLQEIFYDSCYHSNPNSTDVLKLLLDHYKVGIDFKTRDYGHTLLFIAIDSRDLKLIKWLLDQGANPNAKLEDGTTPLQRTRTEEIRKLLTSYGAK
jgi:hypothetical protein